MAKVLIVDDDPDAREMLATFLTKKGHRASLAPNGSDALGILVADTPDVVVLDYKMPQMDGLTFLEVIRCYLRWQHLPVILMTAFPDGPHIRRAGEYGVQKVFIKTDYRLEDLADQLEICATGRHIGSEPAGPATYLH